VAFVRDMQIPVDKKRVVLVWKKSQKNHLAHEYDDFKHSLPTLAVASIDYQIKLNEKKLQ